MKNHGFEKKKEFRIHINDKDTGYCKKINVKQYKLPNGIIENFYTDVDGNSVQIFPITKDNQVFLVKQWRPGIEKEQFELPGGGLEDSEDKFEAALRELKEETGLKAGNMVHLGSNNYSPYSSGIRHMFLAYDCEKVSGADLDPNEFLEIHSLPLNEFRKLIQKGQVRGFDTAYLSLDYLNLL
jgi:ADP-ribose pyrophosphatase